MAKKKTTNKDFLQAICIVSNAPIRRKPDDRSEIISQILYGETCLIEGKKGKNWIKIKCSWDNYVGWMDPKQLERIALSEYLKFQENNAYCLEIAQAVTHNEHSFNVLLGSNLPSFDGMSFKVGTNKYVYTGQVFNPQNSVISPEILIKICKKYLHAPYLWGGRSPFGIDCSGLTQQIFKMLGISLPRDSQDQALLGEVVNFIEEVQLGDLAFFENKEGQIHHVGIIMEDKRILHASGAVRIDHIDHYGIYRHSRRKYTHKLRIIRRLPIGLEANRTE